MAALHRVSPLVVKACWIVVGVAFALCALAQAVLRPERARGRLASLASAVVVEPWLLAVFAAAWIVLAGVPRSFWRVVDLGHPVVTIGGLALLSASTILAVWTRFALGAMWSASARLRQDHELRTSGPYRIARHSMYTGGIGMVLGSGLALGQPAVVVFSAVVAAGFFARSRAEERLLIGVFGDRYLAYRRRVGALFPNPLVRRSRKPRA